MGRSGGGIQVRCNGSTSIGAQGGNEFVITCWHVAEGLLDVAEAAHIEVFVVLVACSTPILSTPSADTTATRPSVRGIAFGILDEGSSFAIVLDDGLAIHLHSLCFGSHDVIAEDGGRRLG